ncbi:hypothetical protein BU15DRAFT_67570 [Melanogaster broomeanus]|nr:hypothetical protein BU15DRAFT_67570 [Melanogaster broomeanus]
MTGSNVWPSDDLEYYHAVVSAGRALFPLFALALKLPETYFSDMTKNSVAIMRTLHYPLQDGHPDVDDETPVLQVMNSEKRRINAPRIKGTLVVNAVSSASAINLPCGQVANDASALFVRRCLQVDGTYSDEQEWQGAIFYSPFFGTDYHVNIEPIPSCVSANRHSPITAGDYTQWLQQYGTMSFDHEVAKMSVPIFYYRLKGDSQSHPSGARRRRYDGPVAQETNTHAQTGAYMSETYKVLPSHSYYNPAQLNIDHAIHANSHAAHHLPLQPRPRSRITQPPIASRMLHREQEEEQRTEVGTRRTSLSAGGRGREEASSRNVWGVSFSRDAATVEVEPDGDEGVARV